jgi:hypothetical protein
MSAAQLIGALITLAVLAGLVWAAGLPGAPGELEEWDP